MASSSLFRMLACVLVLAIGAPKSLVAQEKSTTNPKSKEIQQINTLFQQGKWENGRKLAADLLKTNNKDADVRMLLGKYYQHKGNFEKSRFELVKALQYAPAHVEVKHLLIAVETSSGRYSSAICYINELLEINPYWKGLWRHKIELYRLMGNDVEADRLLKRIAQIYPEDAQLKLDMAFSMEQKAQQVKRSGKLDQSIAMGKVMIENNPQESEHYLSLIDDYIKSGDYETAMAYTDRAVNTFPNQPEFIHKKIALLDRQQRYTEILSLLDLQMKQAPSAALRSQQAYFLSEAARQAKNNNPATLYGKILDASPTHQEAFDYVIPHLISQQQYPEALSALQRYRKNAGNSKKLDMLELDLYRRSGDVNRTAQLTEVLFIKYPNDTDLRDRFLVQLLQRAKDRVLDGNTTATVAAWNEVLRYGNSEERTIAHWGLYNTYVSAGKQEDAVLIIDEMLMDNPGNTELLSKKADLYYKGKRFGSAFALYEQVMQQLNGKERDAAIAYYGDNMIDVIKMLRENYELEDARMFTERWLALDPYNQLALLWIINLTYQLQDLPAMLVHARSAEEHYPDDVNFKIKLAEARSNDPDQLYSAWQMLYEQALKTPYHEPLTKSLEQVGEQFAGHLLKEHRYTEALGVADSTLPYVRTNIKEINYLKGLAYEGLKRYDSAYYFQQFYEPALMEWSRHRQHLTYLFQRSHRNEIEVSHLYARFADDYRISGISTLSYQHIAKNKSAYTGRVNYAGRDQGKGIQGQLEWYKPWNDRLYSRMDLAVSNRFFAKMAVTADVNYLIRPEWYLQSGVGYRTFYLPQQIGNLDLGAILENEQYRIQFKWSNFLLQRADQSTYLYSLLARGQYYLSNPRNYLLTMVSIGNSPDVDLLDAQLANSFNVLNVMVGAGAGFVIHRNVSAGIIGSWYNFQSANNIDNGPYRNLYNVNFQLRLSF